MTKRIAAVCAAICLLPAAAASAQAPPLDTYGGAGGVVDEVAGGGNGAPVLVPTEELPPVVAGEVATGPAVVTEGDQAGFTAIAHTPESQAGAAASSRERLPLTGLDALLLALGGAMLLGVGMGVRSLSRSLA